MLLTFLPTIDEDEHNVYIKVKIKGLKSNTFEKALPIYIILKYLKGVPTSPFPPLPAFILPEKCRSNDKT